MTTVCFVDVETTGTDPFLHELWEIGLIVRRPAEPTWPNGGAPQMDLECAWHVAPNLSVADPVALQVNGFYQRAKATSPDVAVVLKNASTDANADRLRTTNKAVKEVAAELARLVAGATLVAVNVDFDATFISKFLRVHGQCPTWDYHKVEVLSLAAGHLHMPPPWTSGTITQALGVPHERDRHTGLGDARIVRDIYDQVYAPVA